MLEAGRLRHRVDFERQVRQTDPANGDTRIVWTAVAKDIPAAIEPLSVREYIAAQAVQSEVVARIVVRFKPEYKAAQRIVHRSQYGIKVYNPSGVLPDKDSGTEFVTIPVTAGVNDG